MGDIATSTDVENFQPIKFISEIPPNKLDMKILWSAQKGSLDVEEDLNPTS